MARGTATTLTTNDCWGNVCICSSSQVMDGSVGTESVGAGYIRSNESRYTVDGSTHNKADHNGGAGSSGNNHFYAHSDGIAKSGNYDHGDRCNDPHHCNSYCNPSPYSGDNGSTHHYAGSAIYAYTASRSFSAAETSSGQSTAVEISLGGHWSDASA